MYTFVKSLQILPNSIICKFPTGHKHLNLQNCRMCRLVDAVRVLGCLFWTNFPIDFRRRLDNPESLQEAQQIVRRVLPLHNHHVYDICLVALAENLLLVGLPRDLIAKHSLGKNSSLCSLQLERSREY